MGNVLSVIFKTTELLSTPEKHMPYCRRSSKRQSFLFAVNFTLFATAWMISSIAILISSHTNSLTKHAPHETYATAQKEVQNELDEKYSDLLAKAKLAIESKEIALKEIREQLVVGYVVVKDFEITDNKQAHWLSEPKLMLGVSSLMGGNLIISYANNTKQISVGERIDFVVDDCDCFILLKSSAYGSATFRFACTPAAPNHAPENGRSFVEAKLHE
ncbi:hypothetical protein [Roseovarius sp. EL26]|uniref:hypothetical protein n=1 Tax=Roseovarius sp. EL26 TaxID=2126672 RepID=UPI000EA27924|nr:hypothetical protein [Roseovarius sp. EL26]